MISLILLEKIFSMFLIMCVAALLVKTGVLKSTDSKTISTLHVYAVTPCSIILSFQVDFSKEIMKGLLISLIAGLVVYIFFFTASGLLSKALKMESVERASVIFPNALNLIIPLVSAVLGPEWIIYTSVFSSLQLIFLWSKGKAILCGDSKLDIKKIVTNPNIISIFIGLACLLLKIKIPGPITSAMNSLANCMGAMGMLIIGTILGGMDLKKVFTYKRVYLMSFLRLVVLPLPMVLLAKLVPLSIHPDVHNILLIVLLACMAPTAVTISSMSALYGGDKEYASAIGIVSMCFCVITMPLMAALFQL